VRAVAFEGAEVMAEAGARDRLQGQLGHVAGHVHRPSGGQFAVPVVRQPFRHGQHHRVVAGHRLAAEAGGQDVVRQLPVGLVVVRREQPVPGDRPQIGDAEADVLGEPRLVRHVGHQVGAPHEHELLAEGLPAEDRAQLAGVAQRILERGAPVGADDVTEEREPARRMRDAVELGPALLGAPESLRQRGRRHRRRLRHDAISLDPLAGSACCTWVQ